MSAVAGESRISVNHEAPRLSCRESIGSGPKWSSKSAMPNGHRTVYLGMFVYLDEREDKPASDPLDLQNTHSTAQLRTFMNDMAPISILWRLFKILLDRPSPMGKDGKIVRTALW